MNAFLQRERGVLTEKQRCVALYLQTVAVCQRFAYRIDHAVLQGFGIGGHAGDRVRRNQRLTVKLVGIRVGSDIILRKPVGKCIRKSDVIRVGACRNSGFSVSVIERDVVADRGSQAGSAGSDIRVDDTAVDFNCTASEHSAADRIAVNGTSRCDTGVDDAVVDGDRTVAALSAADRRSEAVTVRNDLHGDDTAVDGNIAAVIRCIAA